MALTPWPRCPQCNARGREAMSHNDWRCDRCGLTWSDRTGAKLHAEVLRPKPQNKDTPSEG